MGEKMDKRFDIPWTRLTRPLGALFAAADVYTRRDKKKLLGAWRRCAKNGQLNGCRARKEIRELVSNVADAINVQIQIGARVYVRQEISETLTKRVKRKKRRALE